MDNLLFCLSRGVFAIKDYLLTIPAPIPKETQLPYSHTHLLQGPCLMVMTKEAEPKLGGRGKTKCVRGYRE